MDEWLAANELEHAGRHDAGGLHEIGLKFIHANAPARQEGGKRAALGARQITVIDDMDLERASNDFAIDDRVATL